ncbi:mannitol dehydrogenase family protein [Serpentinicella alkaliphila]|uniref:Fructuronate reductase n=1 Tax=Serpentinicella alkaliphila TaxID=1734049 RepID=A0A4R2TVV4_9FIRM|nr:mannitol dehydrogenase family protein [Serpentinicella alkaliphila]QUH26825.1 mannitol dehydrogenase family protein [Serpentinicella alkaliphila]TCQ08051.1 fructuronate reductase [Serpentinicella alkaliphila]
MKLNLKGLSDEKAWRDALYNLPKFSIEKVKGNTKAYPNWVHFGAGNIFRAFIANVQQNILNEGKSDRGIVVAEGFDYEIIENMNKPHDNLSVLVTLRANGSIEKTVIASIVESLIVDTYSKESWCRLKEIFTSPSLQMVSFTITEKGYSLKDGRGGFLPAVIDDFNNGPQNPVSYIGKLVSLLYERYMNGKIPLALVSMDNMSHNGTKLLNAVSSFAKQWIENGFIDNGFEAYVSDPKFVAFPWSMIDKITPRPDPSVREMLQKDGFEDIDDIVTSKNTYVAPFVNAEESEYLVIEDLFPNGRPNLEEGGVIFTDRETVDKVEKMKVCTCLNPLHTALAIYGCLLGYTLISKEMKDPELRTLVEKIGYEEGLPVVVNPIIIDPKEFIDEVLQVRFPNPFMPDTPQRIASDTSQKLGIRFGETIKAYMTREDLNVTDLKLIPLVIAGWCRYLIGLDDNGEKLELSPDPLLEEVAPYVRDISFGDKGPFHDKLKPILSNTTIFSVNLYDAGIGEKVEIYFEELVSKKGAVRDTLKKYVY